jgi:hypothetical protein
VAGVVQLLVVAPAPDRREQRGESHGAAALRPAPDVRPDRLHPVHRQPARVPAAVRRRWPAAGRRPERPADHGRRADLRTPAITTLQSNTSFAITPLWTAQWGTTYDFRNRSSPRTS